MSNVEYVEVYIDDAGDWRWRAIAGNHEIVATGESHGDSRDAERAARGVLGEDIEIRVV